MWGTPVRRLLHMCRVCKPRGSCAQLERLVVVLVLARPAGARKSGYLVLYEASKLVCSWKQGVAVGSGPASVIAQACMRIMGRGQLVLLGRRGGAAACRTGGPIRCPAWAYDCHTCETVTHWPWLADG